MRLPSIEKRTEWLMEAIDKHTKTDLRKTEDQYMKLVQSLIRPVVKRWAEKDYEQDS